MLERYKLVISKIEVISIIAILAFISLWSIFFPVWMQNAYAEPAVNFANSNTVDSAVETATKMQILEVDGEFHIVYTDDDVNSDPALYYKSFDGIEGDSWSASQLLILDNYYGNSGIPAKFDSFHYSEANGYYVALGHQEIGENNGGLKIVTSTNGGFWTSTSTVAENPAGSDASASVAVDTATSTGEFAVAYQMNGEMIIATSTNGVDWATTTIADVSFTYENSYDANPLAVHTRGEDIQVLYDVASSTFGYEIVYASSSDSGFTWTTTTVTGAIESGFSLLNGLSGMADAAFDELGLAGVAYHEITGGDLDMPIFNVTTTLVYTKQSADYSWTSTTIESNLTYENVTAGGGDTEATSLTFFSDDDPIIAYIDTDFKPKLAVNTSSAFNTFSVSDDTHTIQSDLEVVYSTSTQRVGVGYVSGGALYFTTSTLRDTDVTTAPTTTATMVPDQATNGSGLVTVTTTIVDNEMDNVDLLVEFSTNSGSTWASTTLQSASSVSDGSLTVSGAVISDISSTIADVDTFNEITFVWDSGSDIPDAVSTTVQIRIRPVDEFSNGIFVSTADFTVDNAGPTAVTANTVQVDINSSTFKWDDHADAGSHYSVSSTAGSTVTTTATSTTFTSISPNTEYSYQVAAVDSFGNTGTYSTVTSSYTDAAVPVSVSGSAGGTTSINLTWSSASNPSGTTYDVYNVNTGSSEGTTTETSMTVTGLTAGTSYTFQVRAQYLADNSTYSAYSSASAAITTNSSGGGGSVAPNPPSAPTGLDGEKIKMVLIAGDVATVNSPDVTLTMKAEDAVQMAISNSDSFDTVSFETFAATKNWTLTEGNGLKTVYVKFRAKDGSTITSNDTVTLSGQGFNQTENPDECPVPVEGAYKHSEGSSAVYFVTENCEKRAFTSAAKYFTYFSTWADVQIVSKSTLDSIPNDPLGYMPYGPLWDPQFGALVKHPYDPKVFLLLGGEKYWITDEVVFEALYGVDGWSWIETIDPKLLDKYATGSEIDYTDHHPNYTVIKYANAPAVYRLEPNPSDDTLQVKRYIVNEAAFNKLGFRWDRIVVISDDEVYEDGENLE